MNQLRNLSYAVQRGWLDGFSLPRRSEGQTLVEYALILVLIAVVVISTVAVLGGKVKSIFSNVASSI